MYEKHDIQIGISACLLGEKVRYDGGHKLQNYIHDTLGEFFSFKTFCPEMDIGLGAPRETIRLIQKEDGIRCVGTKTETLDVTEKLVSSAQEQASWHKNLCGYILKKGSPSCGMENVKLYGLNQKEPNLPQMKGVGLYAKVLQDNFPHLPIEEEGRLGDTGLRENFIKRVYAYRHWKDVNQKTLTIDVLTEFHVQYKHVLMSHDQTRARALGKSLSASVLAKTTASMAELSKTYLAEFMPILKIKASIQNHVSVLQHIQGYLKNELIKDDEQELTETIEQYRQGYLPLIVPVTLLKHHFRRYPMPSVQNSKYLSPHPSELMLLNSI